MDLDFFTFFQFRDHNSGQFFAQNGCVLASVTSGTGIFPLPIFFLPSSFPPYLLAFFFFPLLFPPCLGKRIWAGGERARFGRSRFSGCSRQTTQLSPLKASKTDQFRRFVARAPGVAFVRGNNFGDAHALHLRGGPVLTSPIALNFALHVPAECYPKVWIRTSAPRNVFS